MERVIHHFSSKCKNWCARYATKKEVENPALYLFVKRICSSDEELDADNFHSVGNHVAVSTSLINIPTFELGRCQRVNKVTEFDITKYLGAWYCQMQVPSTFQPDRGDNTISVYNTGTGMDCQPAHVFLTTVRPRNFMCIKASTRHCLVLARI